MSLPVPMARTRTKASAWSPVTVLMPAGRLRPLFGSTTSYGRQTSTPPSASTMSLKPEKSTITKWSMNTPVFCSTVLIVQPGPPMEKAELKRSV